MNWLMVGDYTINLERVLYIEHIEGGYRIHFDSGLISIDITATADIEDEMGELFMRISNWWTE